MELPACLWPRRIGGITCSVRLRVRPGAWMQLSCQHFALEASFAPNGACLGCLNGKERGKVLPIKVPSAKGHVHDIFGGLWGHCRCNFMHNFVSSFCRTACLHILLYWPVVIAGNV